jgi:hypothetical protein
VRRANLAFDLVHVAVRILHPHRGRAGARGGAFAAAATGDISYCECVTVLYVRRFLALFHAADGKRARRARPLSGGEALNCPGAALLPSSQL